MGTFQSSWQNHYRVDVEYILGQQDVASNRTSVTVRTWVNSEPSWNFNAPVSADTSIDGTPYGANTTGRSYDGYNAIMVAETAQWVTHNADGTKTVTIGGYAQCSVMGFNLMAGGQVALPTIPRATTPSWSGNFETGTAKTISLPRAASGFTHDVTYRFGSATGTIATGAGVTASWTPPASLLTQIPSAASGTGTITVVTKNGSTVIGSKSVNFTLAAASSVVPTVSAVTWDDANSVVKSAIGALLQGISQIKGTVTSAGVQGSTIVSEQLIVAGVARSEGQPFTLGSSGTIAASGEATDTRGRVGSLTANLTVLPYAAPSITSCQVIRTDSTGAAQDNGEYLRVVLKGAVQSLTVGGAQKNSLTVKVLTRPSGGAWTTRNTIGGALTYDAGFAVSGGGVFLQSSSFDVQVQLSDKAGMIAYKDVTVAQGGVPIMHSQGQSVGFNRYNPRSTVDVAGDARATRFIADGEVLAAGSTNVAPIGCGQMWFTDTAPTGWLLCRGQAVSRTSYAALYALLGTTYGAGDGSTTFNLPNLQGRVPVGKSSDIEFNLLGKTAGAKTHTLTTNELPTFWGSDGKTYSVPQGSFYGLTTVASIGGGGAHNNIQPSMTINWIIRAL